MSGGHHGAGARPGRRGARVHEQRRVALGQRLEQRPGAVEPGRCRDARRRQDEPDAATVEQGVDVGRAPRRRAARLPQGWNGAPSSRTPSSQASSSGRASSPRSASTPSGSDGATSTRPTPSASAARARSCGVVRGGGEHAARLAGEVEVPDPARVRAQARGDGAAGERGDEGLGPQVLVDVDASHAEHNNPNLYRVSRQLPRAGRSRLAAVPDLDVDVLLIGGGIASATAAATLREEGFDGSVLLVGREPTLPYHRPPASKEYLRGDASADDDARAPRRLVRRARRRRAHAHERARARPGRAAGDALHQGDGALRPRARRDRRERAAPGRRRRSAGGHPLPAGAGQRRRDPRRRRRARSASSASGAPTSPPRSRRR